VRQRSTRHPWRFGQSLTWFWKRNRGLG